MSSDRVKLIVVISLSILLCLLGCVGVGAVLRKADENSRLLPLRSLTVTIDISEREELFRQLRKFGEKQGFTFDINDYGTGGEDYLITLLRSDILINASITHHDPKNVFIGIYSNYPGYPVNQSLVDELFNDVKSYVSQVPNATITEVRGSLRIEMDESQREEFFAQMQTLADEHSLEFTLSLSPDKSVFQVEIRGDGFHITGEPVIGHPGEIFITFFIDYHTAPTSNSLEAVGELFDKLKNLLGNIPNMTITEEK